MRKRAREAWRAGGLGAEVVTVASRLGRTRYRPAAGARVPRELPLWPLHVLFLGYPVIWLLGLGSLAGPIMAVPMAGALLLRPGVRIPRGFGIWLIFLVWMIVSASQIDNASRFIGFGFRLSNYAAATIAFIYIYNCPRNRLPVARVAGLLVAFWVWVVIGGYLGVLFPDSGISTPFERILPGSITSNEYVRDLVHPRFAEVQEPWGVEAPFNRPRAPFAYTNEWGAHYALLLPFVLFTMRASARRSVRIAIPVLIVVSLVPAFATLNRGMFLAIIIGLLYAALRFAGRGQVKWLMGVCGLLLVGYLASVSAGLTDGINNRTEHSATNVSRMTLYEEAFNRTLDSPILGYGAPRPSAYLEVSVGTQGQIWNLMFSFGFPGLFLFWAWFWWLAWRTRIAPTDLMVWPNVTLFMAAFMVSYYGFDNTQLLVAFMAAAVALRELDHEDPAPDAAALAGTPAIAAPLPSKVRL